MRFFTNRPIRFRSRHRCFYRCLFHSQTTLLGRKRTKPTKVNSVSATMSEVTIPETKTNEDVKTESIPQTDQKVTTPKKEQVPISSRKKKTFKIIVIGDSGVGKTCLTYRFCSGKFPSTPTDATIGVDFREKIITLDSNEQVSGFIYILYLDIDSKKYFHLLIRNVHFRLDCNFGTQLVKRGSDVAW